MTPSYALGLFFIFLVSVIWSAASIVVQYLYQEQNFESPFLLTYIGTSLFIVFLPLKLVWERRQRIRQYCCCQKPSVEEDVVIIPWRTTSASYQEVPSDASTPSPVPESQEYSNDDFEENNGHFQLQSIHARKENGVTEAATTTMQVSVTAATDADNNHENVSRQEFQLLSHEQHLKMALKIAPVWFFANWAYNTSLAYTSILSSTVLASTGSLFTFMFAVCTKDEAFTVLKLSGVLLGILGSVVTGLHDLQNNSSSDNVANTTATTTGGHLGTPPHHHADASDPWAGHALWGDAIGLLSAVGYGGYTILIRVLCPKDERCMSMQLLLGYIGLLNGALLFPIALKLVVWPEPLSADTTENDDYDDSDGSSTIQHLTWLVFGYLVAKGMLDNVLSDYLWARAVVLTSATVATVGLGLTIPLAFVSDVIMGRDNVISLASVFGALAVLSGFVLVNLDGSNEQELGVEIEMENADDEIID